MSAGGEASPPLHSTPLSTDPTDHDKKRQEMLKITSVLSDHPLQPIKFFNWLVIGFPGVGKSALFNSILTALALKQGQIYSGAFFEAAGHSHGTVSYEVRSVESVDPTRLAGYKLRFCDLFGVGLQPNQDNLAIELAIDGQLPSGFKTEDRAKLTLSHSSLSPSSFEHAPHGLLFIMNADKLVKGSSTTAYDLIKTVLKYTHRDMRLPCLVILTHIDEVDPSVASNPATAYQSKPLADLRAKVANAIEGVKTGDVLLVKNYTAETSASPGVNAPLLLVADKLLDRCRLYHEWINNGYLTQYAGARNITFFPRVPSSPLSSSSGPRTVPPPPGPTTTVHTFPARTLGAWGPSAPYYQVGDITVVKDVVVTVIDSSGDFWKVMDATTGQSGTIPKNYLQKL